ncbi:MAG: outer membrane lipoprotein-sorting protein [Verrucomicrobiales bacterium]|nr:outer membrane lipoprotein-sorting protein [Verrucomicrobiales bacterium]
MPFHPAPSAPIPCTPRLRLLVAACLACASLSLGLSPAFGADSRDAERGRALALAVRNQRPAEAAISTGTLRIRGEDGRRTTIPIEVRVSLGSNSWSTVYQANFADGRRETLTVVNLADAAPHFILHRSAGDGNIAESRPQRPDELFVPFASTDFWFADLGMVFLHWPEQRWLGRETRRTRACNMLESRNPFPLPGSYQRVVTWIDEETGGIVRAEAYDDANRLLKEFSPGSFARVGARYELRDMEIRHVPSDSRTTLQFDIADPEKLGMKHLPTSK